MLARTVIFCFWCLFGTSCSLRFFTYYSSSPRHGQRLEAQFRTLLLFFFFSSFFSWLDEIFQLATTRRREYSARPVIFRRRTSRTALARGRLRPRFLWSRAGERRGCRRPNRHR